MRVSLDELEKAVRRLPSPKRVRGKTLHVPIVTGIDLTRHPQKLSVPYLTFVLVDGEMGEQWALDIPG